MDSLDYDINSVLNYYVKQDNVLFVPATNDDEISVTVSKKKRNTITTQPQQQFEQIFSNSSPQHHASIPTATAQPFRLHSIETQLDSLTSAENSLDGAFSCKKTKSRIFSTKTRKRILHYPRTLLMKNQRQTKHKGDFIGTAVETSGRSMDISSEVPLSNQEVLINTDSIQPVTEKNVDSKHKKHKPHLFKSLLTKWRRKDNFRGTAVRSIGRFFECKGGGMPDDIDSGLEPITNKNVGIGYGMRIPNFLKSLLIRKSQESKQIDILNRTSASTSGFVANLKGGASSVNNHDNEVQVQKSFVKDCTASGTAIDMVDTARPMTVVTELNIGNFEKAIKCDCEIRRLNLIVDSLNLIVLKNTNKDLKNQKIKELQQIDPKTCHFMNCPVTAFAAIRSTEQVGRSWKQSQVSLYSIHSCLMCQETDDQLEEDIVGTLLPLMEQLENENDLNIPLRTIEFFQHASCYDHFKEGLLKVIGSQCTPKNLARLHYLMRRIIQHIGDSTDAGEKKIENILTHAKQFNQHFYQPHIKTVYQSLTNFLLSGLENSDVD